jgi:GGDEF domain-containing protein
VKLLKMLENVRQLIREGKLNEAYSELVSAIEEQTGNAKVSGGSSGAKGGTLSSDLLAVVAGLIKALSLNSNFRQSDDLIARSINRIEPKDDHFFLTLADELVHQAEVNVNTTRENAARCDKLLDQAIRIREVLVGADGPTAELIIESVLSNLQRARHSANNNMAPEAGARLARCRILMGELERLMVAINRPGVLLLARVCTLRAFFAHSSGQKALARDNFTLALSIFEKIALNNNLERSDVLEMFMDQAPHFTLSQEEKQSLERIKQSKQIQRRQGTIHKIRAFPTVLHIEEIMEKARTKAGKSFYLTSLGFLGAQSLTVSVICDKESRDLNFKIEPSKTESSKHESILLTTDDSAEVLRHIKDLWRKMQAKPTNNLPANLQKLTYSPEAFDTPAKNEDWSIKPAQKGYSEPAEPAIFQNSSASYGSLEAKQEREAAAFEGNLKAMPSFGLLQTIGINQNTGLLEVSQRDGMLRLYFENGKPVHGSSASQEGIDVLYDFVLQEEGFFRFIPEKRPGQTTIRVKLDSFILEAANLFDQTKYLKSLGLTMYSGLFSKESVSEEQELAKILQKRGVTTDDHIWQFYQALEEHPIVADAVDQAGLPLRQWTPALYKLVQSGLVNISNDRLDDEDLTQNLITSWSYDRKAVDKLAATLYDQRSGLLRFEFLVWTIEKEVERAQTQMWPLSIMIFDFHKQGKEVSKLSANDKELVQTTLAEISDCKRSIDWLCHFEDEQFALLMPGLDATLAAMFAKNFADICNRNLGKLREGHSDWEYSFGVSSMPGDTIEWQKMVGFACEAQRKARTPHESIQRAGSKSGAARCACTCSGDLHGLSTFIQLERSRC